jgi:hypothetical protein
MTMTKFETTEIVGAAYWASAIFNGDTSGMEEREIALYEAWEAKELGDEWTISGIVENDEGESEEPWFSSMFGFHTGWDEHGITGGDCLTYVAMRPVKE